ncbi:MAG: allophanate hydrolase [Fibrobacteres bacterium]|nr:allophanate hydrolase [Fibrobacterota bacterium]
MTTKATQTAPLPDSGDLESWSRVAREGMAPLRRKLTDLVEGLDPDDASWIEVMDTTRLEAELSRLEGLLASRPNGLRDLPLFGVPFAIKDNIDAAGWHTTAACPAYRYLATEDAAVVGLLREAGAVVVGKTNLDQFATGLVGTRSPFGTVPSVFSSDRIGGGSSSGSASVVARGIVPFALGTDTAGSGRVPAGFQNIVGLKPTRGWFSTRGVVPACRTLDCVSIFALSVADAHTVSMVAGKFDPLDPFARPSRLVAAGMAPRPRFAVPSDLTFFGDTAAEDAFRRSIEQLAAMEVRIEEIDFRPFADLASLLYQGPWVAERLTVVQDLLESQPQSIHPVVRGIVEKAASATALETFRAEYRRAELASVISRALQGFDALVVPTAPCHPTLAEVEADPVGVNSRLGTYTNFANLADLSALALPALFRADGLPSGITLLAPAWHDQALAAFGTRWMSKLGQPTGSRTETIPVQEVAPCANGSVELAVVGAHLSGMPLNHQLVSRGARLLQACRTAPGYSLHALAGTVPPKPGLVRASGASQIAVEVWEMPLELFGSFVAEVPAPLGIGNIQLETGRWVKGFICESIGLEGAKDITAFGGWKRYIASLTA